MATFKASLPFVDEYVLHDLKDRCERAVMEVPRLMSSCLTDDTP
ncbi:hypothetical protein ACN28S_24370 [Cystobacter fuscus]